MSGGHFNYTNDSLCELMFDWSLRPDYGEKGFAKSLLARRVNPLEDAELSEIVYDLFCVLHSYDWYVSGDTSPETYYEDVLRFKQKWLKTTQLQRCKRQIDLELAECRSDLYRIFGLEETDKDGVEA